MGDVQSYRSAMVRVVNGMASSYQVSPRPVAVSCEWSAGPAQHCSCLPARLVGINGAACPYVLQVMLAQVSGVSKTFGRALETCGRAIESQVSLSLFLRPMTL
jgi:hypothetical protein